MTTSSTTTEVQTSRLDRFFDISARGSTVGREVRGGLVTFFTMAYIIVLNPIILSQAVDETGAYIGGGSDQAQGSSWWPPPPRWSPVPSRS